MLMLFGVLFYSCLLHRTGVAARENEEESKNTEKNWQTKSLLLFPHGHENRKGKTVPYP